MESCYWKSESGPSGISDVSLEVKSAVKGDTQTLNPKGRRNNKKLSDSVRLDFILALR